MPIHPVSNVSFGHRVSIDPKILKNASKKDLQIINNLKRKISSNRIDQNLSFVAVVNKANEVVNVRHIENGTSFERMYPKEKPVSTKDFIEFLQKNKEWHENRYYMNRMLEEAFGN